MKFNKFFFRPLYIFIIMAVIFIFMLYQIGSKDKKIKDLTLQVDKIKDLTLLVDKLDSELTNYRFFASNSYTVTPTLASGSPKYAFPLLSCEPTINNKKLPGREIGVGSIKSGSSPDFSGSEKPEKKFVSIEVFISISGSKPIQIAADDFSLVDEKGGLGVLVEDKNRELIPCELNFPRRSDRIFLSISTGSFIRGKVSFIVDDNINHFKLIYSPLDIPEKATFDISTEMPPM